MIDVLIDGVMGKADEATLTPNHSRTENDNEIAEVTEWLKDGVVVHRSVELTLKKGLGIESVLGRMG